MPLELWIVLALAVAAGIALYGGEAVRGITNPMRPVATAEARIIHTKLFPFIKSLFMDGNPVGIKHAMKLAGQDTGAQHP